MATENEKNVNEDVEHVTLKPEGGENVDPPEKEDLGEGAEDDEEGDGTERKPRERMVVHQKPDKPTGTESEEGEGGKKEDAGEEGENQNHKGPLPGETPREYALRLETERLRGLLRKDRSEELGLGQDKEAPTPKKEISPKSKEVLAKYKPEEINALREVIPALAEEMGFVRGEELTEKQYKDTAQAEFDNFMEKHPEYSLEKDPKAILWNRFREEFQMYKPPNNPKDYRKIFNRIHTDIFGIKPAGDKGNLNAAEKKITVASHGGAEGPNRQGNSPARKANASGLRLDMLKGFDEDEIQEMTGGE